MNFKGKLVLMREHLRNHDELNVMQEKEPKPQEKDLALQTRSIPRKTCYLQKHKQPASGKSGRYVFITEQMT